MPLLYSVHIICVYRYTGDRGIRCTHTREATWSQILQYENQGACQDVLFVLFDKLAILFNLVKHFVFIRNVQP